MSAILRRPDGARTLLVLAHGAGAGMRHPFLDGMAGALARRGVATYRYQFPYMEAGRRRPDRPAPAEATVRAAVDDAARAAPDLPLLAGGKSFGGRMTSSAAARAPLPGVRGIVFLGFPLHAPRRPALARAEHLRAVTVPLLFLQGTRDDLADLEMMRGIVAGLGSAAALHVVEGANHAFAVPKRSGKSGSDVLDELAGVIDRWSGRLVPV